MLGERAESVPFASHVRWQTPRHPSVSRNRKVIPRGSYGDRLVASSVQVHVLDEKTVEEVMKSEAWESSFRRGDSV